MLRHGLSNTKMKDYKFESELSLVAFHFSDSRGIQTHNLLIRSQMLYSVELGSHVCSIATAKLLLFELLAKFFAIFF